MPSREASIVSPQTRTNDGTQQMARIAQKLDEVVCEIAAMLWLLKAAQR
jgi:hypothetical protein